MLQMEADLTDELQAGRALVARIGRFLFDRHLTDAGGGNISLRIGDVFCMSPTLAGQNKQWQLEPDDVLVVSERGDILQGDGGLTRESAVHFGLHRKLRRLRNCGHPRPSAQSARFRLRQYGDGAGDGSHAQVRRQTPVIEYAPAHSPKLGERIVATLRGREALIAKQAAGTLAPWHGLFLMGKNLNAALDAVERLDTNAYMIMMSQHLGASPAAA